MNPFPARHLVAVASLALLAGTALAQEAVIRKALAERLPQLGRVAEISPSPIAGLFEVRTADNELYYTDADGGFLVVRGQIVDTKTRRNLTEERQNKLNAIEFKSLQTQDAFTVTLGNGGGGKRQVAVFADPNCGYCKRFERDMVANLKDATVHVFLVPVLGPDSLDKSRLIWCAKNRGTTWQDWMVRGVRPMGEGKCDTTALQRNQDFAQRHRITGTPTLVFMDGRRVPGAVDAHEVDKMLRDAARGPG